MTSSETIVTMRGAMQNMVIAEAWIASVALVITARVGLVSGRLLVIAVTPAHIALAISRKF